MDGVTEHITRGTCTKLAILCLRRLKRWICLVDTTQGSELDISWQLVPELSSQLLPLQVFARQLAFDGSSGWQYLSEMATGFVNSRVCLNSITYRKIGIISTGAYSQNYQPKWVLMFIGCLHVNLWSAFMDAYKWKLCRGCLFSMSAYHPSFTVQCVSELLSQYVMENLIPHTCSHKPTNMLQFFVSYCRMKP